MSGAVIDAVAAKLRDPQAVAVVTDASTNRMVVPSGPRSPWLPLSLSDGLPAVSLLHAELGDPVAHDYLAAALASGPTADTGLFRGPAALAFAANACGGYPTLLSQLDGPVRRNAELQAAAVRSRVGTGDVVGTWCYDVINGLTGIGRLLLSRAQADAGGDEEVRDVLAALVEIAVADDRVDNGRVVPAWWVRHDVSAGAPQVTEHLNLGLAHGIPGPLALLALAWSAGRRVPRQDDAIRALVALIARWRRTDEDGPHWPNWLTAEQLGEPGSDRRGRDAWCYGAAGLGRALYLAGVALGEQEWLDEAHAALRAALTTDAAAVLDHSLCHGWAGLLQIANRMALDTGDPAYRTAATALARHVTAGFEDDAPFGYRLIAQPGRNLGEHRPGFLDGAAGIALALDCQRTGRAPRTSWDEALLIS